MRFDLISTLLILAVIFLWWKVQRLEAMVQGRRGPRGSRRPGDPIPLLKDDIEPGPFARGNRDSRPTDEDDPK